jgi:hypothetical protein
LIGSLASAESEFPCHEHKETSAEESIVCSSTRRLLQQAGARRNRPPETFICSRFVARRELFRPTIIGHYLAGGVRAPLRL